MKRMLQTVLAAILLAVLSGCFVSALLREVEVTTGAREAEVTTGAPLDDGIDDGLGGEPTLAPVLQDVYDRSVQEEVYSSP